MLHYYKKDKKTFEDIFGIESLKVISEMNKEGDDIPNQTPLFKNILEYVGVERNKIPITIKNPLSQTDFITIICKVEVFTSLPETHRGIHMSRIGNVISELSKKQHSNLIEYSESLCRKVSQTQYMEKTMCEVNGDFHFLEKIVGISQKKNKESLESIQLHTKVTYNPKEDTTNITQGIKLTHITACPCVQMTLHHTTNEKNKQSKIPNPTHSQRCETLISIKNSSYINPIDILHNVDDILFRTTNTLPREHEALLVYLAHKKPQFIEDVVRETLVHLQKNLQKKGSGKIFVQSRSMESIHNFDIKASGEILF